MYKSIFLSTLLVPFVCINCSNNNHDADAQKIKETFWQKAQELSDLSEKIYKKKNEIECIQRAIEEVLEKLISNVDLTEQKKDNTAQELHNFSDKLQRAFYDKIDVNGFLADELIVDNNFNQAKFMQLDLFIENMLLKKLVVDYEINLQQLAEINHELVLLTGTSTITR